MEKGAENKRVVEGFSERRLAHEDKSFLRDYLGHLDEKERTEFMTVLISVAEKIHSIYLNNKDTLDRIISDGQKIHDEIIQQAKKDVIEGSEMVYKKEDKDIKQIAQNHIHNMQNLLDDLLRDDAFRKQVEEIKREIKEKEEKLSYIRRYSTMLELSNALVSFSFLDEHMKTELSKYTAEYVLYLKSLFAGIDKLPDEENFTEINKHIRFIKSLKDDKEALSEMILQDSSFREKIKVAIIELTDIVIGIKKDLNFFLEHKPFVDYIEFQDKNLYVSRKEFPDFHTAIEKRSNLLYGQITSLTNENRKLYQMLELLETKENISSKELAEILKEVIYAQASTINTVIGEYTFLSKLRDAMLELQKEDLNINQSISKAYNNLLFEIRKSILRLDYIYQLFSAYNIQEFNQIKEEIKNLRDEYIKAIKDLVEINEMNDRIIENYEKAIESAEKTIENYEKAIESASRTIETAKKTMDYYEYSLQVANRRAESHFNDLLSYMRRYG